MNEQINVALHIDDRPGILSSAVITLRRFGLRFEGHHFEDADGGYRLTLHASGELTEPDALRVKLESIKGVIAVDGLGEPYHHAQGA